MPHPHELRNQAAADGVTVRPSRDAPALTDQQIRDTLHPHRSAEPSIRVLHDTGAITADTAPALGILDDQLDGDPAGDMVHDVLLYAIAVGYRPAVSGWGE